MNTHCPMIHGGLQINLKKDLSKVYVNHCCLRHDLVELGNENLWTHPSLSPLRDLNKKNIWDKDCWTCQGNELAGFTSFRTGSLEKFGEEVNLSGPKRLDLMFDIGCNLACRTCGPEVSTFWQKHLTDNNITFIAPAPESRVDDMIALLKTIDLSNLEMVVFCGGETLLGQGYWRVADAIADMVPHSKERLTISFQTNGTQPVAERNYKIIEKFHLVKLNISLDGCGNRFEYLRWPASWEQVSRNILNLKETLPVNVMFLIEETISVLNLHYQHELATWVQSNYATNRLDDIVNHTRHVASGIFSLDALSREYVDSLKGSNLHHLVKPDWKENPIAIQRMINELEKFDLLRNQSWAETFPQVYEYYKRFHSSGK